MKNLTLGVMTLLLSSVAIHAKADDKTLNLFSWVNSFDQRILDEFSAKTGYKIHNDAFDSDEMLETKLLAGSSGYDLVTPSAFPFLQRQIKAGAVRPFEAGQVPNAAKLDPGIIDMLKISDPELNHSVPYAWGSTGMGLNVNKIKEVFPDAPLDSYDLMFKPENAANLAKCGFVMVDSATDIVPIAMHYLGIDTYSEDEKEIERAFDLLNAIRPYVAYIDATKYQIELANGSVCAAIGWSGDIISAAKSAAEAKNGVDISYVIPKEGGLVWMTTLAVPSDAPNPEAGYAFMNYLLDPKIAARNTQATGYPVPVPEARQHLPFELAENPALYPPESVKERFFMGSSQAQKIIRYVNRQWTRFRAGS